MFDRAGPTAVNAVDADGQYALTWAASFDCDDVRTYNQPCGGPSGGQCGLRAKIDGCYCTLGVRRAGKLAVVNLLGPRSSAVAVGQALDKAKAVRASFQADVDYHRQDARENREENEDEDEDFLDEDENVDDDDDDDDES
jgi:hypothetical protein